MASTAVTDFKDIKQEQLQEFLHDSIQVPEDLQSNVLVTTLDKVYNWSRRNSMWPLLFAVRTLAVSRDNRDVLTGEAKIGREQVRSIIRQTTLFGWSNHWLKAYYRRLARPPMRGNP